MSLSAPMLHSPDQGSIAAGDAGGGQSPLRRFRGGVAALTLFLAGCAAGHPRTPEIALPLQFEAPAAAQVPVALDRWWTLYGDAQLNALEDEALTRGFSVREALARLDEARAVRRQVGSQFGPQGDINGSASRTQTFNLGSGSGLSTTGGSTTGAGTGTGTGTGTGAGATTGTTTGASGFGFSLPGASESYSLSLPVRWELDLWGRVAAARRYANADLAAARYSYQGARTTLAGDVADQLFQARGTASELENAQATLRIRSDIRRAVAVRAERGIAPRSDLNRVDTDLATAQAEVARLDAQLYAARRSLLALIGRAGDRVETVPITPALGDAPPIPAGLPADLLVRRPDVLEARARLEGALGRLKTAELAQMPTITLTPSAGLNAQRGTFTSTTGFWSIGASLLVPLLDRARLRAEVGIADARTEQAVLSFEQSVQTAFSESDQLIAQLAADRARVTALTTGEVRARASYDAALTQYRLGLTDLSTLLDVEATWRAARQQASAARVDALSRSVQLFKALGGGWSPAQADPLAGRTN
ncbi:TolC family protein [Sphingomonas sp.]|uniref:TolC family protein n=1 Tax=Sphingomonas sp. TaxID=28214 RepID=UPI003CC5F1E4